MVVLRLTYGGMYEIYSTVFSVVVILLFTYTELSPCLASVLPCRHTRLCAPGLLPGGVIVRSLSKLKQDTVCGRPAGL